MANLVDKPIVNITQYIDESHLDCIWYGGVVGTITYNDYVVEIEASGDVDIEGKLDGEEFYADDYSKSGRIYDELGDILDDALLYKLSMNPDDDNYIEFNYNNWFEWNIITPDGYFINCFNYDNVLEGNLEDAFENPEEYIDIIEYVIANEE